MSVIVCSEIDFSNLFASEAIIGAMTPVSTYGSLNAVLTIGRSLQLYFRDFTSVAHITCPIGKIEYEDMVANADDLPISKLFIDYNKLIYTLHQYKDDVLKNLRIEITRDKEKSQFRIICGKDSISLPNYIAPDSAVKDLQKTLSREIDVGISFNTDNEESKNQCIQLYTSISNAMPFVGKDETKNNAGALYSNKFVVNDRRHVFIQKGKFYSDMNNETSSFIPLHKKNMNIFLKSLDSEKPYFMNISSNKEYIHITKEGFNGIFMNSMSSIVPPTDVNLAMIQPEKKLTQTKAGELYDIVSFFAGYYTSASSDFRPLGMEVKALEKELRFFVRDSGVSGFGACAIEKSIITETEFKTDISTQVVFDSLKMFLAKESRDSDIDIYLDNEKPALLLVGESSVYLSKITG